MQKWQNKLRKLKDFAGIMLFFLGVTGILVLLIGGITPKYKVGDCIKFHRYSGINKITGFSIDRYKIDDKWKIQYRMLENISKKVDCE